MDVLVTGGAGFIGSNLVRSLLAAGRDVRVLDDLSTGYPSNLRGVEGDFDLVVGDVRDVDVVREAVRGVEVVCHLAALPSVARSVADPFVTNEVNVRGTLNLLVSAKEEGVRRVVYASSSSVYGNTPTLPKHEEMAPSPQSPYATSKLAGEHYCRAFTGVYGLETISLRLFNVFGPRQDPDSDYAAVIPRFLARMAAGEPPVINGDGRQTRDFTYVDNVVRAFILAASAGPEAAGEMANIGCGSRISILDLVQGLNEALGSRMEPMFAEPRPGDVRDSLASIEKAARLIAYRPEVEVHEGLRRTVGWFVEQRAPTPVGD
jgi:nucleoside-diphosphate-sugar epimerase